MRNFIFLFVFVMIYPSAFAGNVWLEDTDCVLVFSNQQQIKAAKGSLMDAVCNKMGSTLSCSVTAKDGSGFGSQPSTLISYRLITEDKDNAIWQEGKPSYRSFDLLTLDFANKRYSERIIGGVFDKICVGVIRKYLSDTL